MKKYRYLAILILPICAALLSFGPGIFTSYDADILVISDGLSAYGGVVASMMPDCSVAMGAAGDLPAAIETTAVAVEAFDFQANGYLNSGAAEAFYPHYLATVVIAVDRDRVFDRIVGWNDLLNGEYLVSLPPHLYGRYAVLAMSTGLDGGTYDMTNALKLVSELNIESRIVTAPDTAGRDPTAGLGVAPVAILFDYEAAALIKAGSNIEIVIPHEGTLSFAGGLLCDAPFAENTALPQALLAAGFRLPDGACDDTIYLADYAAAHKVRDFERFNLACMDVPSRLRREGWGTFRWTTADGDEHAISFLAFFFIVILWGGAVYMRTPHKGVRRTMLAIIALLVLRVALRYAKTLFGEVIIASRLIWYCYYIPLLLLPVFCLRLAFVLDRPEDETHLPPWWWCVLGGAGAIIILTLTNDLHQLVFTFNDGFANWMRDYGFGPGYHLFLLFFAICSLSSVILLARKAGRAGAAGLLPLFLIVLLGGAFMAADYAKVPVIAQMQTPFVSAVLLLLFFETALRTGFIPSNSRYGALFAALPVDMELLTDDGSVFAKTNRRTPQPYAQFCRRVRGGEAVLRADLSAQHALQTSLEEKRQELTKRSEVLGREQKLKDELLTLQIQNRLYDEVERSVREKTRQIADILATIPQGGDAADARTRLARAAVIACYVKCRSNLLLTGKELDVMKLTDLAQFIHNSAESAATAGVDCAVHMGSDVVLPFEVGTLAYEIFEHFLECALRFAPCDMTVRLLADASALRLTVLLSTPDDRRPQKSDFALNGTVGELAGRSGTVIQITAEDETLVTNVLIPLAKGGGTNG